MNNATELLANPKAFRILSMLFAIDSAIARMLASGEIFETLSAAGAQCHAAGLITVGSARSQTPGLYLTAKGRSLYRAARVTFNQSIGSAEFRATWIANGGGA